MKSKLLIPLIILLLPITGIIFIDRFYSQLPRDTITEGIVGQPRNIHPLLMQKNPVDIDLVNLIYGSLLKYNLAGELVTDLAHSWEVSADGLVYKVRLRDNVWWHDGQKFTADDVIFTATRHEALRQVEVVKLDDYTLEIKLSEVYAPFPDLLTIPIAPEHISLEEDPLLGVGTGPFMISYINPAPNFIEGITLVRVNKAKDGRINNLNLKFFNDRDELERAIQLGEIDLYAGEPFEWKGFRTEVASLKGVQYAIYLNVNREGLLADIDFRKALAQSTPKGVLATQVLNNRYTVIDGPIHDSWATNRALDKYYFDSDVEPQYEGELTLVIPRTKDNQAVSKVLQESWSRLGVDITIKVVEPSDLEEKVFKTRDFDLLLLGREVGHDPDRYSYWHSTQIDYPGLNITGYKQVRVDKALEKGRQVLSAEDRQEHYDLFQEMIFEDVPAIYLYQPRYYLTLRNNIQEVQLYDVFTASDRYKSLDQWRIIFK